MIRTLALCLVLLVPAPAAAAPPADFARRVEALRKSSGTPGAVVAIVENGRTTFARGFGVTDLSAPKPVDADTLFFTGSTGKAFTAAALAILVDQGKIKWDDKVIDHMPDFRLWDPWVTREFTIRDLLVHRSGLGLGAGDLLFVPRSDLARKEIVRRLRFIPPATSFRSAYAYDNVLYVVAGQLIEEVSGSSWEQFMIQNVLRPAGMMRTTVDIPGRAAAGNIARPHARLNGPIRGSGDQEPLGPEAVIPAVAAPAGGMSVSANDMSKWLALQLAHGDLPGEARLFSDVQAKEMWTPQVLMPISPWPEPIRQTQANFSTYALGWNVRDYHGAKIVLHGGGVFGSITQVVLIPEKNVGFSIMMNSEESGMLAGLTYELLDHYLGRPRGKWPEAFTAFLDARQKEAIAFLQTPAAQPAKVGPSLPLSAYAGAYQDPWFGTIRIREQDGKLAIDFPHWPGLAATLEHHQYDTFKTRFNDPVVEPAYVTFALDAEGKVARITMQPVSPIADFSYDYRDLNFTPAP
ncbi:serine hydrolase [Sphingosinicella sp. BN140058]|uniref:serine hydrolase n=1 Tax=Sphingosinicella sp. BN140058 TaxID=1892855 RepID=UPI0010132E3B|nr:serine hydrolase [Sphingosinicella sp. BN140058]QAY77997.1 serine hydrolase [Sphingosinicella sp. BN140058]